jgi:hypothetical protein
MQRREAKIGLRDRKCLQRRKERNDTNENLHRNGLFGVGAGICGLGRTGWWCAQSDANRSPCYLAKNRVIFGKNSEEIKESAKKPL